jgi:hypothetical protein
MMTNIDKKEFIRYAEEHNKDFVFLVVDNTSQSNNPAEFILRTRARSSLPKKSKPEIYDSDVEGVSEEEDSD